MGGSKALVWLVVWLALAMLALPAGCSSHRASVRETSAILDAAIIAPTSARSTSTRQHTAEQRRPLSLDPAVETPAWTQLAPNDTPPTGRYQHALAYDSARGKTVLFGGRDGSNEILGDTWEWDGTNWSQRFPESSPPARQGHAMVYDGARGRTVLFGGYNGSNVLGDTWEWDGTNWTQVTPASPASSPSARAQHAMAYDSARGKTVLFGGQSDTALGDTWEWDGTNWTQVTPASPAPSPPARSQHAMAYDGAHAKSVLFGGESGSTFYGDTWEWDGVAWTVATPISPAPSPSARAGHAMAYDSARGRTVLLGGFVGGGGIDDIMWVWDGANWTQPSLASSPPAPVNGAMAFDGARARTVMFGGYAAGASNDTWEWDGNEWYQRTPASSPSGRAGAAMAFDSTHDESVLFGGNSYDGTTNTIFGDTWQWDGTNWTEASPATSPPARYAHATAYDSAREQAVLFGGVTASSTVGDTWTWDGTNWTNVTPTSPDASPASSPSARNGHAMAYDSARGRTVLFGGVDASGSLLGDTWEWDGTGWTEVTPASEDASPAASPSARWGHAMAYDSARGKTVLFGGLASTQLADTWEWDGTDWTQASTASLPPARGGHAMAYDSARKKTVLFGGSANGDLLGDTWEWDGANWAQVQASSPSARSYHALVYDVARGDAVLFGGWDGSNYLDDTWAYHTRGGSCASPSQCDTGFCVDGVCCEATSMSPYGGSGACGTCQACNLATSPGVCSPVTNAEDPDTCSGTEICNGAGVCGLQNGQPCASPRDGGEDGGGDAGLASCAYASCVDGFCCNSSCTGSCEVCAASLSADATSYPNGTCGPAAQGYVGNPVCPASVCNGSATTCPTTCNVDSDCQLGDYCAAGHTCAPARLQGQACNPTADCQQSSPACRECVTGACADGFCCNTTCTGSCEACNQPGVLGACTPVVNATSPRCSGTQTCNASGACESVGGQTCSSGADCATGYCSDGVCCNTACAGGCDFCNTPGFVGVCQIAPQSTTGANPSCGTYVCNGELASCPTSCATGADCVAGDYCSGGVCVAPTCGVGGGTACAPGYYCSSTGCLAVESNGAACTSAQQCASGFCIDGVCCNSACTGQCEACNVSGAAGACAPVVGAPHGSRDACAAGSTSNPCAAAQCDGIHVLDCEAFAGPSVTCGTASCVDGGAQPGGACDGTGSCRLPPVSSCGNFACEEAACVKTCATNADCALGSACETSTGTCSSAATCDGNHTVTGANGQTTDCAPYRCNQSGKCSNPCASVADCVSPSVCSANGQCVAPPTAGAPGSGCGCRSAPAGSGRGGVAAMLLVLAGVTVRRRKRAGCGGARLTRRARDHRARIPVLPAFAPARESSTGTHPAFAPTFRVGRLRARTAPQSPAARRPPSSR